MKKRFIESIKKSLLIAAASLALVAPLTPAMAGAQTKEDICQGVQTVSGGTGCATPEGQPTVDSTIKRVINILGIVVGVISVIMVIIGGLKYVTSGGESSKISSAKDTILYAVVGLVVVAMSQLIVRFVITSI